MSTLFSRIDAHFIKKNFERKDLMRMYKDCPMAIEQLYLDKDYVKRTHGHDLTIHFETTATHHHQSLTAKKKRRQVTLIKDSFTTFESTHFAQLQSIFHELMQSGSKQMSMFEMADIFMRVSGDVGAVREYMAGKRVVEWSYLEDMALNSAEASAEYKTLMQTKGADQIERRKRFLLNMKDGDSGEAMECDK
ncbi:hypothetical protein FGO68_gene14818 [Halteria grandinella]|uniref:Uncharacterized protein n=1 Tax=Halteria grandinella TaxID=5974 RepID=A0A8J8SYX2_HALGN|nr:hypothetical protein FGO68_gene14818 [Halteria grandinella]